MGWARPQTWTQRVGRQRCDELDDAARAPIIQIIGLRMCIQPNRVSHARHAAWRQSSAASGRSHRSPGRITADVTRQPRCRRNPSGQRVLGKRPFTDFARSRGGGFDPGTATAVGPPGWTVTRARNARQTFRQTDVIAQMQCIIVNLAQPGFSSRPARHVVGITPRAGNRDQLAHVLLGAQTASRNSAGGRDRHDAPRTCERQRLRRRGSQPNDPGPAPNATRSNSRLATPATLTVRSICSSRTWLCSRSTTCVCSVHTPCAYTATEQTGPDVSNAISCFINRWHLRLWEVWYRSPRP